MAKARGSIQNIYNTLAFMQALNPTLLSGQVAYYKDTVGNKLVVGDGVTPFMSLVPMFGASIIISAAIPLSSVGNNGDIAILTTPGQIAQKTGGAWAVVYTFSSGGGAGTVTAVNSVTPTAGNVSLTADNIPAGTTNKYWTKAATDTYYLPLSGGTLVGPLVLSADPTAALQAATKAYVDRAVLGSMKFQGIYSAATNLPNLPVPSTANNGFYWLLSDSGTQYGFNFNPGDWIVSNGQNYEQVNNTGPVFSVLGRTGAVIAVTGDYNTSQVTENTNLYFTSARATGSPLTGLNLSLTGTISASDTLLTAAARLQSQINSAVSVSSMNAAISAALAPYVTSTSLTSTLGNYVTNSAFTSAFSSYSTTAQMNTAISATLAPYVTSTSLTSTLGNYSTTTQMNTAISAAAILNQTTQQASANFNISGTGTAASFTVYATTAATNNYSVTATTPAYSGYNTVFGDGYSTATILYGITTTVPNITVLNTQPLFQNLISLAGTSPDVAGQDLFSFNAYISGAPSTAVLNRNLLSIRNNGTSMLTVSPIGNTMVGGSLIVSNSKSGGIYFNTTANYTVINTGYSHGIEQNITTGVIGVFTSGASNTAGSTTLKTFLYGFDANSNLTFTSNVPVITVTNNMAVQGYFTGALKTNGSLQAGLNSATTTAGNHLLSSASVTGTPSNKYQILNIGITNQISFFAETSGSSSIGFNTNANAGNTANTANEAGFAATMNFNQSTGTFSFLNTATTVALNGILPFASALTIDKLGNGIFAGQLSAQNINLSVGVAAQAPYGIINVSVPNNATSYTAFAILQPGNVGWGIGINSGLLFIGQGGSAATNGANTTMQQLFTFNNLGNFAATGIMLSKGFKAAINGVNSDPYAPISVTNIADASNHSYYSLTRSGVVAWNLGITSGNSLFFGVGGALTANGDNITSTAAFTVDTSGNGTLTGAITSKGTNKQIVTVTANYTVLVTDEVIQCQGTTGAYTVTLPAAGASFLGKVITIIRDPNSSGATITVTVASAAAIQSPTGGYGSTVPLGLSGAAGSRLSYINNGGGGWVLLSSF